MQSPDDPHLPRHLLRISAAGRTAGSRLAACRVILLGCFLAAVTAHGSEAELIMGAPLRVDRETEADGQLVATLDAAAYEELRSSRELRITGFPLADRSPVDLELKQVWVTTPATRFVVMDADSDTPLPLPEIAVFRGAVAGSPDSSALITLTRSELRAVIRTAGEQYFVSPVTTGGGPGDPRVHRIYDSSAAVMLTPEDAVPHNTDDCVVHGRDPGRRAMPPEPKSAAVTFRAGRVALDVDSSYHANFSDVGSTLASIYHLFASISQVFERDLSVKLTLTYIRIWTDPATDPYSATGGGAVGLHEFQDYWIANHSTPGTPGYVDRDSAHLLSGRPVGSAGNLSQLCLAYGYSISGGSGNPDGFLHDSFHASHELGHVYGGHHTHCLTDPATSDWIDKCATESGCNSTQDCSTVPGTIMSYCHFCGGYGPAQMTPQFHPVNISDMRVVIDGACLRAVRNPCYVDWRNSSGTEDGTSVSPYNTVTECVEAVAPGGTVIIADGNYPEPLPVIGLLPIWQPMTISAPGGNVIIGQ